jgi:tetratricopeptide (TPR) repeat protein
MDRKALGMDPLNNSLGGIYGLHLYLANQKDSAFNHLMRITESNPLSHLYLGLIYFYEGDNKQAIKELELFITGFSPFPITLLGLANSKSGDLRETRRMLDTMEYRSEDEYVPFCMRGALLAELGNKRKALEYLKKGYLNKEEYLLVLLHEDTISYANLRSDPEFIEIMGKVKMKKQD